MLKHVPSESIQVTDYGWFLRRFHFSFAEYNDPERDRFGVLEVLNDDIIQPAQGFESHPHNDAEIVAYCVAGQLVHSDGMGHREILERGDVQSLCAGAGINHAEMNHSSDATLRFLTLWIAPNEKGLPPRYQSMHVPQQARHNKWLQVVSGEQIEGVIRINQDAGVFVSEIERGTQLPLALGSGRQAYLLCIEGAVSVDGVHVRRGGALQIRDEAALTLTALEDAHMLMVEMAKNR